MTNKEKEIRGWFEKNWINLEPLEQLEQDCNWLTRNKIRVVVLRDEINRFSKDKKYCKKLENRIKILIAEIEILEKVEDIEKYSDEQDKKGMGEQIPALDTILMRMYGFEKNPRLTDVHFRQLNEWRENEKNGIAYTGRY